MGGCPITSSVAAVRGYRPRSTPSTVRLFSTLSSDRRDLKSKPLSSPHREG